MERAVAQAEAAVVVGDRLEPVRRQRRPHDLPGRAAAWRLATGGLPVGLGGSSELGAVLPRRQPEAGPCRAGRVLVRVRNEPDGLGTGVADRMPPDFWPLDADELHLIPPRRAAVRRPRLTRSPVVVAAGSVKDGMSRRCRGRHPKVDRRWNLPRPHRGTNVPARFLRCRASGSGLAVTAGLAAFAVAAWMWAASVDSLTPGWCRRNQLTISPRRCARGVRHMQWAAQPWRDDRPAPVRPLGFAGASARSVAVSGAASGRARVAGLPDPAVDDAGVGRLGEDRPNLPARGQIEQPREQLRHAADAALARLASGGRRHVYHLATHPTRSADDGDRLRRGDGRGGRRAPGPVR